MLLSAHERMIAKRYLLPGKGEAFIFLVAAFSLVAVALGQVTREHANNLIRKEILVALINGVVWGGVMGLVAMAAGVAIVWLVKRGF